MSTAGQWFKRSLGIGVDVVKAVGVELPKRTVLLINEAITRITLAGALFLGAIAILPYLVNQFTGVSAFSVGGTGLLIVVSVILETIRQLESMIVTKNYNKFLE